LYADDTILLAESREDLQLLLNTFSEYCLEWKLKINVNKTKALIFSKERIANTLKFYINMRSFTLMEMGCLPNSPYTIKFGIEHFNRSKCS
jgi:hypothetical protein